MSVAQLEQMVMTHGTPDRLAPANDFLDDMKYAIVETTTSQVWVEGDERSRTNPGHGYPEGYETTYTTTFTEFPNLEALKQRLKWKMPSGKYRIIAFRDLKVDTEIVVTVH